MADLRSTRWSIFARNAMLNGGLQAIMPGAKLRLYAAAQPATPETAQGGTLLVENTITSMPAPANGAAAIVAIVGAAAVASGNAQSYRVLTADLANVILDGSVGSTLDADQQNIELPTPTGHIDQGVNFTVSQLTVSIPMQGV